MNAVFLSGVEPRDNGPFIFLPIDCRGGGGFLFVFLRLVRASTVFIYVSAAVETMETALNLGCLWDERQGLSLGFMSNPDVGICKKCFAHKHI